MRKSPFVTSPPPAPGPRFWSCGRATPGSGTGSTAAAELAQDRCVELLK